MAKRLFDVIVAALLLVATAPLLLLIALLVKLDSRGPVFFRHRRVGVNGKPFKMFKFRTMIVGADKVGARLTLKRDPRVTRVGQVLRWFKLDELPQLWNVLRGDMSLVGPRPEDPHFVRFYRPEDMIVLSIRPGIIGPNQILGRDEQELFPEDTGDPESFYIKEILPAKLEVDRAYVQNATLWGDVKLLTRGALAVAATSFKGSFLRRNSGRMGLIAADIALVAISYATSFFLQFGFDPRPHARVVLFRTLLVLVIVRPIVFIYYGLYVRPPRFFSWHDAAALLESVSLGSAIVAAITYFTGLQEHSRAVFVVEWAMTIVLIGGLRVYLRALSQRGERAGRKKVLVAGAGNQGELLVQSLLRGGSFKPVGFIDEDRARWGMMIHGLWVLGGDGRIRVAQSTYGITGVLVAASDTSASWRAAVKRECERLGLECRVIPGLADLLAEEEVRAAG